MYKISNILNILNIYYLIMDRKKYISFLDLQAKNDNLNYQANRGNNIGIQTPQQPPDMRTIQEKISNIHQ